MNGVYFAVSAWACAGFVSILTLFVHAAARARALQAAQEQQRRASEAMAQQLNMPAEMAEAWRNAVNREYAELMRAGPFGQFAPPPPDGHTKSLALLRSWLSHEQASAFANDNEFVCIGSSTRRRYTIHYGCSGNVARDDGLRLCFGPKGVGLPLGDVMLAQKIMIENDEDEVLRVANTNVILTPDYFGCGVVGGAAFVEVYNGG